MLPNSVYWMLANSYHPPLEASQVLSPSEFQKFSAFRFPKRRNDWLLGRWTAKTLVHSLPAYQQYSLDQIEVHNTPEGAPYIQLPGRTARAECLTISHSEQSALCALAPGLKLQVGADLEKIETRTETFILDYFTPAERQLVDKFTAETRAMVVTLIWSAKESMLKALGVGLRWDTRMVEVHGLDGLLPVSTGQGIWQKIQVVEQLTSQRAWVAWWQHRDPFVLTLAGFAATPAEIRSVNLIEKKMEG
jgi:4'-phosphopantetheinyl transferase